MEKIVLKIEEVLLLLPKTTSLIYVDRDDFIPKEVIQDCIHEKSMSPLWDKIDNCWYWEQRESSIDSILQELKNSIRMKYKYDFVSIDNFIDENKDEIFEEIYNRCNDTVEQDLLRNTSTLLVSISLMDNCDGLNSSYYELFSYNGYLKEIIDILNINPYLVKKELIELGYENKVWGTFPNKRSRNGKEIMSTKGLVNQLMSMFSACQFLTVVGILNVQDLLSKLDREEPIKVTIPKGNRIGFYSWALGACGIDDDVLLQDFTVELDTKRGCEYNYWFMQIDGVGMGYSINDTCSVTKEFFGGKVKIG